jgi:hypothetical protein
LETPQKNGTGTFTTPEMFLRQVRQDKKNPGSAKRPTWTMAAFILLTAAV